VAKKKKLKKVSKRKLKRGKITPASVVGLGMGLLVIGGGYYAAVMENQPDGYWVIGLGLFFTALVLWGTFRKR
jgi:hypothetical protein